MACLALGFYACSNDDNDNYTGISSEDYYALKIGNSWVYKYYELNSETNDFEFIGTIDSVSVIGKETLFGDVFFKIRTLTVNENEEDVSEEFTYVRTFDGFLIDDANEILFVNNDFSEHLVKRRGFSFFYGNLQTEAQIVQVNNESLSTQEMIVTLQIDDEEIDYVQHYFNADGIGLVKHVKNYFIDSGSTEPFYIEKRLDSYNIN